MTKHQPIDGDPTKMRPPAGAVQWEAREAGTLRPLGVKRVWAKSWFEAREKYRRAGLECDPVMYTHHKEQDVTCPSESTSKKPPKAPLAPSSKSLRVKASKKKSKSASSSARSLRRS